MRKIQVLFYICLLSVLFTGCDYLKTPKYQFCGSSSNSYCCSVETISVTEEPNQLMAHKCVTSSDACARYAKELYPDDPGIRGSLLPKKSSSNLVGAYSYSDFPSCSPKDVSYSHDETIKRLVKRINEGQSAKIYPTSINKMDPFLCKKHCDNDDAFCEESNGFSSVDLRKKIISSLGMVKKQKGKIEKQRLMNIFDQNSDECDRGDLFFKNGILSNVGRSDCIAKIHISNTEKIELLFPKELVANYNISSGLDLKINQDTSPIFIKHNRLDSVLNGALSYLHVDDSRIIARVDKLCIEAPLVD